MKEVRMKEARKMSRSLIKVTTKGQVTIPVEYRRRLSVGEQDYLEATLHGEEIVLRKVERTHPLSAADPVWELMGMGSSGLSDVSERHDDYLADGEVSGWKES